jgi:hypothetical protein
MGNAPRSAGIAAGFGYVFSPFFEPQQADLDYCLKIYNWWRAIVKAKEQDMGVVRQINASMMESTVHMRMHRLISEASPNMAPKGYFDCTAEVSRVKRRCHPISMT